MHQNAEPHISVRWREKQILHWGMIESPDLMRVQSLAKTLRNRLIFVISAMGSLMTTVRVVYF